MISGSLKWEPIIIPEKEKLCYEKKLLVLPCGISERKRQNGFDGYL